jgi:hypothetical protein
MPMKRQVRAVAMLLLGVVAVLPTLAYAAPPDPTWIAGVWDDGDYDDVIFLITSDVGAINPQVASHGGLVHAVVIALPQIDERPAGSPTRSSSLTRAPPVSSLAAV